MVPLRRNGSGGRQFWCDTCAEDQDDIIAHFESEVHAKNVDAILEEGKKRKLKGYNLFQFTIKTGAFILELLKM